MSHFACLVGTNGLSHTQWEVRKHWVTDSDRTHSDRLSPVLNEVTPLAQWGFKMQGTQTLTEMQTNVLLVLILVEPGKVPGDTEIKCKSWKKQACVGGQQVHLLNYWTNLYTIHHAGYFTASVVTAVECIYVCVCACSILTVEIDHSHLNDVMMLISCLICFLSSVNGNRLAADSTTGFCRVLLIINYGRQH